jgi:hypothetical protein
MNGPLTRIQQLRLLGAPRQPVQSWLASAELQPASLPPQAILLVRQLRARGGWGSVNAAHHWSEATRASLAQLLQQAARPAAGVVPEQAPAVLFADTSEMLACLCRDWLAGQTGHWWWRCLYPAGVDAARLYALLLKHCLLLPALLQRLAQQPGLLLPLLLKLPLAHALRLVQTLALEYAVSDWPDLPPQQPVPPGKNRPGRSARATLARADRRITASRAYAAGRIIAGCGAAAGTTAPALAPAPCGRADCRMVAGAKCATAANCRGSASAILAAGSACRLAEPAARRSARAGTTATLAAGTGAA